MSSVCLCSHQRLSGRTRFGAWCLMMKVRLAKYKGGTTFARIQALNSDFGSLAFRLSGESKTILCRLEDMANRVLRWKGRDVVLGSRRLENNQDFEASFRLGFNLMAN